MLSALVCGRPGGLLLGCPRVPSGAYASELIERLNLRIRESQARAARTLNTELVMLYWSIGRDILDQQQAGGS